MKKVFFIFVVLLCILFGGCENKSPFMIFSSQPVTRENIQYFARAFKVGQKVHFAIVYPRGLQKGIYRALLMKKDDKSEFYGYSYYRTFDFKVDKDETYYLSDELVIHEKGWYALEFFNMKNKDRMLLIGDFWVKE